MWEDKSILRSHGTPQGDQKEKDENSQEYSSLSISQKGSDLSQKIEEELTYN